MHTNDQQCSSKLTKSSLWQSTVWKTLSTRNSFNKFDEQRIAFAAIDKYVIKDTPTDIGLDNDTKRQTFTKQEPFISVNFSHAQSEHRANF